MMRFIFRRVLLLIPMLFGTSLFIFLILRLWGRQIPRWIICGYPKFRRPRRQWKVPVSCSVSINRS